MIFHQAFNSSQQNHFERTFYTSQIWEPHFHRDLELIFVISGNVRLSVRRFQRTLQKDEFALCLPFDVHSIHPNADASYWVCVFSESLVPQFAEAIRSHQGDECVFTCEPQILQFLHSQMIDAPEPSDYMLRACLYTVCDCYCASVNFLKRNDPISKHITTILCYIEENHTRDIRLSDLAQLLRYDYHYTSRLFHTTFSMSFSAFLNQYRLETAVRLIEQTQKSMTVIAYESGFQSIRSFHYTFRQQFGFSPSQYRKNCTTKSDT